MMKILMWLILICSTHPSLRNMVANLSFLAHVVPWNYKCPLKIENWLFQTSFDLQEAITNCQNNCSFFVWVLVSLACDLRFVS